MSDNGSQPINISFMNACRTLQIDQVFASYNNPKGNANTERVFRTIKEDCIWIREWNSLDEAQQDVKRWIENYNHLYPHSVLNNLSPVEFESAWDENINKMPLKIVLIFGCQYNRPKKEKKEKKKKKKIIDFLIKRVYIRKRLNYPGLGWSKILGQNFAKWFCYQIFNGLVPIRRESVIFLSKRSF